MNDPTRISPAQRGGLVALVLVVVGIVAVAFRGSWGAFRDAALASHFDGTSANLYPFAVDGLMVVAIIALVLLRHDPGGRRYCLFIIGAYTCASLLVNFLHGLGMFVPDKVTGERPVPPWPVVLVIALLVVGSIFLGSHLLVYVWRHVFPEAPADVVKGEVYQDGTDAVDDGPAVPVLPPPSIDTAKVAYRASLAPELKTLSQQDLVDRYGISKRQAGRIQSEVKSEIAAEAAKASAVELVDEPAQHTVNGRVPARTVGDLS
jgi:hypothetical protein